MQVAPNHAHPFVPSFFVVLVTWLPYFRYITVEHRIATRSDFMLCPILHYILSPSETETLMKKNAHTIIQSLHDWKNARRVHKTKPELRLGRMANCPPDLLKQTHRQYASACVHRKLMIARINRVPASPAAATALSLCSMDRDAPLRWNAFSLEATISTDPWTSL